MLDFMGDRLDVDSGRQLTEFALSNEKLTRKDSHYWATHEKISHQRAILAICKLLFLQAVNPKSTKLKYFKLEKVKFDPSELKDWTTPGLLEARN